MITAWQKRAIHEQAVRRANRWRRRHGLEPSDETEDVVRAHVEMAAAGGREARRALSFLRCFGGERVTYEEIRERNFSRGREPGTR